MSAMLTLWAMNPDALNGDGNPWAVLLLVLGVPMLMLIFMCIQGERDFRKLRRSYDQ